ncbi:MAG TPA: hypothetical protein PLL66_00770 [Bacteroidales bacterium]|nr:hypothetical protein [Bacteroidales bacterium]
MKKTSIKSLLSVLTVLAIVSCVIFSSCKKWVYDDELNDIQFKKYRYAISDNDTVSVIGYIEENKVINEIPCASGWVHFTADMKLKLFCLSETIEINNVLLPAGSWIVSNYSDENLIVVFPEDTLIGSFPVKGGGGSKGVQTSFYDNGNIKSFFPYQKFEYQGKEYKKSIFNSINLDENGNVVE